jgi:hypothetical protein
LRRDNHHRAQTSAYADPCRHRQRRSGSRMGSFMAGRTHQPNRQEPRSLYVSLSSPVLYPRKGEQRKALGDGQAKEGQCGMGVTEKQRSFCILMKKFSKKRILNKMLRFFCQRGEFYSCPQAIPWSCEAWHHSGDRRTP